jgi:hypothetical protein
MKPPDPEAILFFADNPFDPMTRICYKSAVAPVNGQGGNQ